MNKQFHLKLRLIKLGLLLALLLVLGARAFAQQQPSMEDPALLPDIARVLQVQRNQALNDVAVLNAMLAKANARIKDLEKPPEPPK